MRISVLLSAIFLWMAQAYAQETLSVSGVVTDVAGEPLIGVTVAVKGTATGASTDLDGAFSLNAKPGDVLKFSYIGYKTIEETVSAGRTAYNVVMYEDAETLDEVVVTALGIKREQKSLSYNVQQIKGDALTENKDANFINGLAGKVAGVNINASSSGVGGISKVVMRGTKSIMQSSNALYVVDGMPMRSANNGDFTEFGSQGATEPIADLNPEDIESMSVLTGAAAAALYGSEAANGAIVITTKKGQAGKTKVTYNSSLQWDRALVMHKLQNRYGTGINGEFVPTSNMSWGAPLSSYNSYNYQPGNDYFQTGFVSTQSVTISTGNEKNQTYASVAAVNSLGITPNNRYDRYNFNIRNTSSFLNDRMTLDLNAGYVRQTDRNMVNQGVAGNPFLGALLYPRGNSWDDNVLRALQRRAQAQHAVLARGRLRDAGAEPVLGQLPQPPREQEEPLHRGRKPQLQDPRLPYAHRTRPPRRLIQRLHAEILRHHQRRDNRRFQPRCIRNHQKQREAGIRRLPPQLQQGVRRRLERAGKLRRLHFRHAV